MELKFRRNNHSRYFGPLHASSNAHPYKMYAVYVAHSFTGQGVENAMQEKSLGTMNGKLRAAMVGRTRATSRIESTKLYVIMECTRDKWKCEIMIEKSALEIT